MDNKKLHDYLFKLEKHLSDLSPSDRSKIILDIENHIEDSLRKYSDKSLDQILEDLGSAERVANHYRLDRGLKTFKPNRHPILKWFSITFLGSIGLFLIFILTLIWKFTPVFEVDEKNQRVTILGGLIDINGTSGKIKVGDEYKFVDSKFTNHFEGSIDFPKDVYDELVINFKSGQLNLNTASEAKLSWSCKLETPPNEEFMDRNKGVVIINLENYEGIDCDIQVPPDVKLTVDAKEGQVTLTDAEYDSYIELANGLVYFNYNPEVDYSYDIKVKNGTVSRDFISSGAKEAYEVKIYIENGKVDKI